MGTESPELDEPGGDRIDALTTQAGELTETVGDLFKALRRNRQLAFATAAGLVLDVILTIVLTVVLNGQADTNRNLQESLRENYVTSQEQAQTRIKVLCPLYEVMLASTTDPTKRSSLTPAQQKQYDASVKIIKDGFVTLNCPTSTP